MTTIVQETEQPISQEDVVNLLTKVTEQDAAGFHALMAKAGVEVVQFIAMLENKDTDCTKLPKKFVYNVGLPSLITILGLLRYFEMTKSANLN